MKLVREIRSFGHIRVANALAADLIVDKFDAIKDMGPEKIQSLNLGKPDLFSELTWE